MPFTVHEQLVSNHHMRGALNHALEAYIAMVDEGEKPEEARMCLPNACTVTLLWTVDLRNLMGFMEQRCCERNVKEMKLFTDLVYREVKSYWPEYAVLLGPYCYKHGGKCNQGSMSCGQPWKTHD